MEPKRTQYLGLLCVLCHQAHRLIQPQTHIFSADTLAEALLVTLHISCQIQLQVGFGFPIPILALIWIARGYTVEHAWSLCLESITNVMYQSQK